MTEDRIADARNAAEQVFEDSPPSFEPTNINEAQAAVRRLGQLFEELPGLMKKVLVGAKSSGSQHSADRLQGLAEIVQNADDVEASQIRILLRANELLLSHDGTPVHLPEVAGLATPWLSTKPEDSETIGRFGIGLSTLRSLSDTLEVHCDPYHFRIGDPTIAPIEPPTLPSWFVKPNWTTLRIPLLVGTLGTADLEDWLDRWDDSALLFLRHVTRVTLCNAQGQLIRRLEVSKHQDEDEHQGAVSVSTSRELTVSNDGRRWALYRSNVPTPAGVKREGKATDTSTPIAVAIPLSPTDTGQTYAGLPVAPITGPFFANAQFDPITSRADFADTPWNEALVDLVASLWSEAILDRFARDPQATWQAIPLPPTDHKENPSKVIRNLEAAVLAQARQTVASYVSFPVSEHEHVDLSRLAVEAPLLEGILQEGEIAKLAGLSAAFPLGVRDAEGRWRAVLSDWRSHNPGIPEPVGVEQALDLVDEGSQPAESTIALVAAALQEGLDEQLLDLPCLITHDGRRVVPPSPDSTPAVSTETAALAEHLGVTTLLHSAHLADNNGAPEVLEWLRRREALLDGSDDLEVLRRLARVGRSEHTLCTPLRDEQLRALADAFERIDPHERADLGPNVGRAVTLESYTYDAEGHKMTGSTSPASAYLPRSIDKEPDGLAVGADKTQQLLWLSDRFARTLRSQAGRDGIGPQKFLRLLGAETAPRLRSHPQLTRRYQKDRRRGLPRYVPGEPQSRRSAMAERGAKYTLEDHHSPDLLAIITNISQEDRGERRRERAGALLAALGRAWDSRLSEFALVEAVDHYHGWLSKGKIRSFWLAQSADIAWLDDQSGAARRPAELRVRTPGTEAIYGSTSPDYLHADLDQKIRRPLLSALGVLINPNRSQLVKRLRELRNAADKDEISFEEQRRNSALVYRALARSLDGQAADSELTATQLQQEFARGHLVHTNCGWLPPRSLLSGPPIFGELRAFAPAIPGCEPLWSALRLRPPSPDDCLDVLRQLARYRTSAPDRTEEAILLDTLRTLAEHHAQEETVDRRKLATLALWTSKGWTRDRPVYASDDPVLVAGLGDRLPVWRPGGGLEQFRSLPGPLRVTEIRASEARIVEPELAQEDHPSTDLFRRALDLLRDDLSRNDPDLAEGLKVPWSQLEAYAVRVHPVPQTRRKRGGSTGTQL